MRNENMTLVLRTKINQMSLLRRQNLAFTRLKTKLYNAKIIVRNNYARCKNIPNKNTVNNILNIPKETIVIAFQVL